MISRASKPTPYQNCKIHPTASDFNANDLSMHLQKRQKSATILVTEQFLCLGTFGKYHPKLW